MRILLVRPPVPKLTIGLKHIMNCEPLELEYVAAGVRNHEVQIMDMILESGFKRRLREYSPDLVGTSSYITGVNEVVKLCREVKMWNRRCLTVVGGVHASVAPEDFADPAIDCIALGDGTSLLPHIVSSWIRGEPLTSVANLAIPRGPHRVELTENQEYMTDPDSLPLPRRDLTKHLRHRYYYLFHQPVATVKTTWGCWYDCSFCMTWRVTRGRTYSRSPESIVSELASISEREIYIVDDIFLIHPKRLSEIAELIRRRGINKHYLVYARADFLATHEEIVREWAELGLTAVIIGLEAATQKELTTLRKRTTIDQNREAVEVLRRQHVDTYASFIPLPEYTKEDWENLYRFIEKVGLYYVNISPLTPLPGSPNWDLYSQRLTVDRRAHPLWDLTHCVIPTRLPLKQFYRELLRLYARTVLSIRRAHRLTLRTRPPVWSWKYLRLWLGAWRIFTQFMNAHLHHHPKALRKAMDRGPDVPGLSFRLEDEFSGSALLSEMTSKRSGISARENSAQLAQSYRLPSPVNPYHARLSTDSLAFSHKQLLDFPSARQWHEVVSWGIRTGLYNYQQPFSSKSGPYCMLNGIRFKMISSYDYLGLIGHPEIEAVAIDAIRKYGTGTGGVRLLTGSTDLHRELEDAIARFKDTEACVTYSSGYVTNLAAISSILQADDLVILDSQIHRSLIDSCRMARVRIRKFKHNDCASLEVVLKRTRPGRRTLIVVEGIYSMDGDICPLPEIVSVKNRYGAYLMIDEAHSFGTLGATGRGIAEHLGVPAQAVDIWMGSLSKAIPSTGGYIAGSRELIMYLHHGSAPFMFSSAAAPATVAAALASLRVLQREPQRLSKLAQNAISLRTGLAKLGFNLGNSTAHIIPVILGADKTAYQFSHKLFEHGIISPAIVFPAVARGSARLRLCATAAQDSIFIEELIAEFHRCRSQR